VVEEVYKVCVGGEEQRAHGCWCRHDFGGALIVILMARIFREVSSVTGGKVPVHFKVVVSQEHEAVDEERPHVLNIIKVDYNVVAAGVLY
jgi:hypothetical protein